MNKYLWKVVWIESEGGDEDECIATTKAHANLYLKKLAAPGRYKVEKFALSKDRTRYHLVDTWPIFKEATSADPGHDDIARENQESADKTAKQSSGETSKDG